MFILFFLVTFKAMALINETPKFELSFPRDNTFCTKEKVRVEFLIRSGTRYTQPDNKLYGENIFYEVHGQPPQHIPTPEEGNFKLLKGSSILCTKGQAFPINNEKYAILFLKENRPFKDRLLIQFLDPKTLLPIHAVQTNYLTDKAKKIKGGFAFRSYSNHPLKELSQVKYEGENYLVHEKNFPIWIDYTEKGFAIDPKETYLNFSLKKFFNNQKDFLTAADWDEKNKDFKRKFFFHGVSHKLKKECVVFLEEQNANPSDRQPVCQTMKAE